MNPALTLSLLAAGLTGCATPAPQLETEHTYQVEWIGERPLIDNSHLTITLGDDGRAYGNAGCNHWFAGYTLEGDTLSFSAAGSTRKMCAAALMEQEARFLDSLSKVQRWDFSATEQLQLWPADGKPLRLWPERWAPPLSPTTKTGALIQPDSAHLTHASTLAMWHGTLRESLNTAAHDATHNSHTAKKNALQKLAFAGRLG